LSRGLRLLDIATHHYEGKICLPVPFLENPYKDASQHRPRNWSKEETNLTCTVRVLPATKHCHKSHFRIRSNVESQTS
jgi:hypothetical protein